MKHTGPRYVALSALALCSCQSWNDGAQGALVEFVRSINWVPFALCHIPMPDMSQRVTTGQGVDSVEVTELSVHVDSDLAAHGTANIRIQSGADFRAELPPSCSSRVQFTLNRAATRQFMFFVPGERRVSVTELRVLR